VEEIFKQYDTTCEMLVSVKETKSNPYYVLREENQEGWLVKCKEGNFIRRQDCPKVYELNGAIYIIDVATLKSKTLQNFTKIKKFIMDEKSSHDIDNPIDWLVAEALIQNNKEI
jgi:N-acylneuraminate cytidylyltransferase